MIAAFWRAWLVIVDAASKVLRRYAIDVMPSEMLPDRWCSWGRYDRARLYFILRLPSFSYEYNPAWDRWQTGQLTLGYVSDRGWRTWYVFR